MSSKRSSKTGATDQQLREWLFDLVAPGLPSERYHGQYGWAGVGDASEASRAATALQREAERTGQTPEEA